VLVTAYLLGGKKRTDGKGKHGQLGGPLDELTTAVQLAGGGVRGKLPGSYQMEDIGEA
jgi:hypothetical protein